MKIAVIATAWFPLSHADVIVSRWVQPFGTDARCGWRRPEAAIASAHIEQRLDNDIGVRFCRQNGVPVFETIAEALTLGGSLLAVDAVLLIGEHGDYPRNEFGQKLYPRKRFFDEIAEVFRSSGRSVPVFNDKHFSWDFEESRAMLSTARELAFPLYGGSSLPHCPLQPERPVRRGERVREAVSLFHGDPDAYGFHSLEFALSLLESRGGGETGIEAVRAWSGEVCKSALARGDAPLDLVRHALSMQGFPEDGELVDFILSRVEGPWMFQLRHSDGLCVTHLLLPKFVSKWTVSVRLRSGEFRGACLIEEGAAQFFGNFARLNVQVNRFFETGVPPNPVLRTHLATGALQACLQAVRQAGEWRKTPHLSFGYDL